MLAIIAVLLCVACCSGETSPQLWGSRVVGKPSGKSDTMNYRYGDQFAALVLNATTEMQLTIEDGQCMVNGTIWGTPCQDYNGTVNITLNDVNMQKVLWTSLISNGSISIVTTFFVPYCNFSQPSPDEVDLKSSFPLSRFVQGQQSFPIDFAVGGSKSNGGVSLDRNGVTICEWRGVNLVRNSSTICDDLVKNETANLRIFHANFTLLPNVQQEVLTWKGDKTRLSVTVDYTQSGISPEVAECDKYRQEQTSTTSSGPASTPTTSASTTSSGPALTPTTGASTTSSGETSPQLWGSRVVGKPSGKSDTMNYRYGDQFAALVLNATTEMQLTIEDGQCMVNGTIWGTPCQDYNGTVNITLNDVNMQKVLWTSLISNGSISIVTTFFVPYCNFSQPSPDEVDLKSSFPLSRFVQGQQSFPIDFAVGGSKSNGGVSLDRNGVTICEWRGVNLVRNSSTICDDLVKNETANLRIFHANFTLLPNVQQEVLTWKGDKTRLSVTVDYTQSGISPEVAECDKYRQEQTSTTSSGPAQSYTTGASTTSSGPVTTPPLVVRY
ncbi:hypothetical protein ECG_07563 [Echinococcus granulosus]|nr:hypothetical protein ECG_07563 [Echinococcus granulosus]